MKPNGMKDVLLATGTTKVIVAPGPDEIGLVETLIEVADGVVLRVINREVAGLHFGNNQRLDFKFNEEIAAAFVNIDDLKPAKLLAIIASHSGVSI